VLSLMRSLALAVAKPVGAVLLGGAFLWEVALHCGPPHGKVYVHVAGGFGDVTVDDSTYHVKTLWESPIVRELEPGQHIVRMSRDGCLVFEQEFSIDAGEELILAAWDRSKEGPQSESANLRPGSIASSAESAP
jgi:hypothetical protein